MTVSRVAPLVESVRARFESTRLLVVESETHLSDSVFTVLIRAVFLFHAAHACCVCYSSL